MTQPAQRGPSKPFGQWCKFRGISRNTGYRLLAAGEIQTYKIGARRYVSNESDNAFMTRKEQEATA